MKNFEKSLNLQPENEKCTLCLQEKLAIGEHKGWDIMNKRSEAVAKCIHQNKYAVSRLDDSLKYKSRNTVIKVF